MLIQLSVPCGAATCCNQAARDLTGNVRAHTSVKIIFAIMMTVAESSGEKEKASVTRSLRLLKPKSSVAED